ncbi:MAG: hypothetical protein V1863_05135 [Candidatus Omnitrophota bacterium]
MDLAIFLIGLVFLGIGGLAVYTILQEKMPSAAAKVPSGTLEKKLAEPDLIEQFHKKIRKLEEQVKQHEAAYAAVDLELAQTREREKKLTQERSQISFDSAQVEKFKKDHQDLKRELGGKEELLEQEIAERRKHAEEIAALRQDHEAVKKRSVELEDALRKSQTMVETLTKQLQDAKRMLQDKNKMLEEHSTQKKEGEWVARAEFEKIETSLKEKEALVQRLLSLKSKNE